MRIDSPAVCGELQLANRVKEPELHAAVLQNQVKGCEYNVAHAGLHHVADMAPVGEQQLEMRFDRSAGGEIGLLGVAVLIGKAGVVNALDDRRCFGKNGAMLSQPLYQCVIIDSLESAEKDPVGYDAADDRYI